MPRLPAYIGIELRKDNVEEWRRAAEMMGFSSVRNLVVAAVAEYITKHCPAVVYNSERFKNP